jgi:tRNA pseudouridine38-40 synthase
MCPDNFLGRIQRALPADIRVFEAPVVMASFYAHGEADKRRYNYVLPLYALTPRSSTLPPRPAFTAPTAEDPSRTWTVPPPSQVFDYTSAPAPVWNDDLRGRFRRVLAEFVGSKSYHSFTPKGIPGADQCRRVITDITVSEEPISAGPGLPDYVIVGMTGQSFILNQIRKMIGLTVAIVRGDVEHQAAFPAVFDSKCNVPLAPGNGLFLKGVVFDRYETKSQKLAESKQGIYQRAIPHNEPKRSQ